MHGIFSDRNQATDARRGLSGGSLRPPPVESAVLVEHLSRPDAFAQLFDVHLLEVGRRTRQA